MLVKVCKKALLFLVVVMLLISTTIAASASSALVGGDRPSGDGDSLRQYIDGGIEVIADSVSRGSTTINYALHHYIWLSVTVIAEGDTIIEIKPKNIYDNLGHEFNKFQTFYQESWVSHGVWIGGQISQGVTERFIVAGVPTPVRIYYVCDENYRLASSFPRVSLSVNGEDLIFRDVPGVQ